MNAVPIEVALKLCEEIRRENERKRFGIGKLQCSMCYRVGRKNPDKLCIFNDEMNRGCPQVNKRYDSWVRGEIRRKG